MSHGHVKPCFDPLLHHITLNNFMHKIKDNLTQLFAYERYDVMCAKIS